MVWCDWPANLSRYSIVNHEMQTASMRANFGLSMGSSLMFLAYQTNKISTLEQNIGVCHRSFKPHGPKIKVCMYVWLLTPQKMQNNAGVSGFSSQRHTYDTYTTWLWNIWKVGLGPRLLGMEIPIPLRLFCGMAWHTTVVARWRVETKESLKKTFREYTWGHCR